MKKTPQKSSPKLIKEPLFITFEGGEGVGKTTLIHRLKEYLEALGHSVVVTREPGGSRLGDKIRELLLHRDVEMGSKAELLLFLAARAQHVEEVIIPSLKANKIILCDRFTDSSVAYQGYARGLGMDNVLALSEFVTEGLTPDLTFFLDLDPKIGLKRTQGAVKDPEAHGKPDRIEAQKQEFHKLVREAFQKIAKTSKDRVKFIDATKTPEDVFKAALELLPTC